MDAFWQLLRELWKVGHGVQAVVLNGKAVLMNLFVVVDYFLTCDPSFNQDTIVSYFAVNEVVRWVIAPADFNGSFGVLCCPDLILEDIEAVLVLLPFPIHAEHFRDSDFTEGACDMGLPPVLEMVRAV